MELKNLKIDLSKKENAFFWVPEKKYINIDQAASIVIKEYNEAGRYSSNNNVIYFDFGSGLSTEIIEEVDLKSTKIYWVIPNYPFQYNECCFDNLPAAVIYSYLVFHNSDDDMLYNSMLLQKY